MCAIGSAFLKLLYKHKNIYLLRAWKEKERIGLSKEFHFLFYYLRIKQREILLHKIWYYFKWNSFKALLLDSWDKWKSHLIREYRQTPIHWKERKKERKEKKRLLIWLVAAKSTFCTACNAIISYTYTKQKQI